MKRSLLIASGLLTCLFAHPQAGRSIAGGSVRIENTAEITNQRILSNLHKPLERTTQRSGPVSNAQQQMKTGALPSPALTSWKLLGGSMNVYGVLESSGRPLGFNDELNVISFIHRKSTSYVPSPVPTTTGSASGVIVGMFTDDWGGRWDSTCIWNNPTYYARYPQGGIYSPPSAPPSYTSMQNAFIIAAGPVTTAQNSWQGSFIASKQLDTIDGAGNDNVASLTNTLFAPNYSPFHPTLDKFDFPGLHFSSTDDGVVRMISLMATDYNGTTNASFGFHGARIITGKFNHNTNDFDWSGNLQSEVFDLSTVLRQNSGGYGMGIAKPHMCWNEDGQIGYVWFIGSDVNETAPENMGYQPIVYKSADGGNSWTKMLHINFLDTLKYGPPVLSHLFAARGGSTSIPHFLADEGMDGIVDRNGDLHILTTLVSSFTRNTDSMGYTTVFTAASSNDGQAYRFGHRAGMRPYIYDFICSATNGWDVLVLDSMSSEGPGTKTTDNGYHDNPWDANGGTSGTDKVETNARLQWSRDAQGGLLVATWAESDTLFTINQHKWNGVPDVKARLVKVGVPGSNTAIPVYTVHPNKINITNSTGSVNVLVAGRATMHYVADKCINMTAGNTCSNSVCIGIPLTVSNNQSTPLEQASPVNHWFASGVLNFDNVQNNCLSWKTGNVGLHEHASSLSRVGVFPNPANEQAVLTLESRLGGNGTLTVMSIAGQNVRSSVVQIIPGTNRHDVNLRGLQPGMYVVTLKSAEGTVSVKLVVEAD